MDDAGSTAEQFGRDARARLEGHRFHDVRWVDETASTNSDAIELARQGAAAGTVLVAERQTAGRGRRGRNWEAPRGAALTATILLRPRAAVAGLATMALALAAAEVVETLSGVRVGLKWPNDLVWPGDGSGPDRKLAGILAEADWPAGATASGGWPGAGTDRVAVAVGIGLNVAWAGGFPPELADTAVSLDELTDPAPPPSRLDLLVGLVRALDILDASLDRNGGAEGLRARWEASSATIGRRVRVDLGHDDVEGTAVGLSAEGHLLVDTLEGERRTLAVGDVVHLRARPG